MTLADHAVRYARRGWAVFPLQPGGKAPMTRRGFQDATTDQARVRRWWGREPAANIGIATGERSGIAVLDVDDHDSLEALECEHGDLDTLWAVTGSGGMHLLFTRPPDGIRNSASRVAPGIDVRGDGGYIVAPPSVHPSGSEYRWGVNGPIDPAPMPDWLQELCRPRPVAPEVPPEHRRQAPPVNAFHGATSYGRALLRGMAQEVAEARSGQRNETLNYAAYRVGRFVAGGEIDRERAAEALLDAAAVCGLPPDEAHRTLQGGLNAGWVKPLTAPKD